MKHLTGLLVILLLPILGLGQLNLTSDQWQEDLGFLQKTIHDDYSFLFKKTTAASFDAEVEQLHNQIPSLDEHQIIAHLARIVASFGYGHTSIPLSGWHHRDAYNFKQMAFHLKEFSDGIYIQGTTTAYENALGAKVLQVAGIDVTNALSAVKPFFPAENDEFFQAYGLSFLGNAEVLHTTGITDKLQTSLTLTLEKDGQTFLQTFNPISEQKFPGKYTYVEEAGDWLDARNNESDPLYLKNLDRIYYFESLPEQNTLYVRHSQIQDDPEEDIPSFYERVFSFIEENEVDKLVLDVRLNGGGNNYKNKPIVTGVIKSIVNKPGKFFVITSGQTYSACQNLVNELSNYTEAIFVGEPTGENINFYGDNNRVELPNSKIPIRLSFAWWQDKPQWEGGDWLAPHIYKQMSFQEYVNNEDPVLEAALKFDDDNFILKPMEYLSNLYQTGQGEKLQAEAIRMVNEPNYSFFDFEGEFNQLGYNLLGRGDAQTAIQVFQMVTSLFPDSANGWDSLAEGYWKSGDTDKAIEYYNKAIEMDPEGVGINSREMLKKIKEGK